jgi:catechol 2,3-dioxygenase-like lactoylglutathione lyase family enzyme
MPNVKLDHCVIHVSDWEISNTFYRDVLGAELIPRESGWSYRFGGEQLNLHGPGVSPAPVAKLPVQPGNSDLCFEWPGPIDEASSASAPEVPARASTSATRMVPSSSSSRTMKRSRARTQHERTGPS